MVKEFFLIPKSYPTNQYVDRDNRRGSEKNDGYFTMNFNGNQWEMIKNLYKKSKLINLNVLSLSSLFKNDLLWLLKSCFVLFSISLNYTRIVITKY